MTIPCNKDVPAATYLMSGYKPAGSRAIRIDMLERLADLLRGEDSRGGFEANPDMLSITGMTLEQFADLMEGLGYKAERGERDKPARTEVKPEGSPEVEATTNEDDTAAPSEAAPEEEPTEAPDAKLAEDDTKEIFFTFTWAGNRANQQRRDKPQGKGQGGKPRGKGKPKRREDGNDKPRSFEARPKKKDTIDPDNPFAQALMGLKDKGN